MKLTNNQIYTYASNLMAAFADGNQSLPIRMNFFIQKNKTNLLTLAQEIEHARIEIAQRYGEYDNETDQFVIPPENIELAQAEFTGLFELEQEVNIGMIKADSLSDDFNLTTAQMEAIMFMIEEA